MRIPAVFVDPYDGQIVGDEMLAAESLAEPLLDREFVGASVADLLPNPLEAGFHDAVHRVTRLKMSCNLLRRHGGFEAGYQIGRRNHFDAKPPHQLQHSAIDQRNIHDLVLRRVLHRDALVRA